MAAAMMEGYNALMGEWTQFIYCPRPLSPASFSTLAAFLLFSWNMVITHTIPMDIKPLLQSVPYFLPSLTVSPAAARKRLSSAQLSSIVFQTKAKLQQLEGLIRPSWTHGVSSFLDCSEILVVPSRSTRDYKFTRQTLINETGSGMTLWEEEVCTQRGPCTEEPHF